MNVEFASVRFLEMEANGFHFILVCCAVFFTLVEAAGLIHGWKQPKLSRFDRRLYLLWWGLPAGLLLAVSTVSPARLIRAVPDSQQQPLGLGLDKGRLESHKPGPLPPPNPPRRQGA